MQRLSSNPNFRERKSPILIGGNMDEGDTSKFYSGKETFVFWNFDDYPVPVDTDLGSICSNIEHALRLMGFDGYASINVDCKKLNSNEEALYKAKKIFYLPYCTEGYRKSGVVPTLDMTFYMIYTIQETAPERSNVAVIVKPNIDPNSELHRILHCLKSRGHNVLLIEQPPDGECLFSVDSLLKNSRLLGGGKPRVKKEFTPDELRRLYEEEEEEVDGSDDVSNLSNKMMLDFSVRTKHVKGDRTVIFWDAIDCPFPLCFSPDQIFEKIKSPLLKNGLSDNITIWAYVDERSWRDKYLGNKTWHSRIYFLPAGDKASRRIRMLNDINLWIRDSPQMTTCYEASLVLVSDQFKDDDVYYRHMLQKLGNRHYYVLLVTPTLDINKPESPEWPGLLIDGGAYFFAKVKSQIYEGPSPTQHEADAEETPEELPIMSDMDYSLLCPFGDQTSDSSEDEDSPFWKPLTEEDMLIDGGQSFEEPAEEEIPLYRWDPHTLMYKLESLFPKEHEADTAAQEEIPLYRWDPHTLMFKLESLFPKDHEADTAAKEETPEKLQIL